MHIKDTAPAAHDHGGGLRFDFAGTRVLVTGGTRGIGKAIVDKFVDAGAQVVVAARRPGEDADEQPSRHFVCTDVTNPDSIGALAERGLEILGGLDVLVNNAGRQSWTPNGTLGISDEQWRTDFDTNLMSSIRLDRALLPAMIEQGHGVIVHITSVQARLPVWSSALPYAVAKAALTMYSKGLANDVGRHGIRVNAVAPALIETEGTANLQELRDQQTSRLGAPLQRHGAPSDIALLVAYLACPAANFITGSQFTVDGGITPTV